MTAQLYSAVSLMQASIMVLASWLEFSSPRRNRCRVSTMTRRGGLGSSAMALWTAVQPMPVLRSHPARDMWQFVAGLMLWC